PVGGAVVLPLRRELSRPRRDDDFSGECRPITPLSTAGSRNMLLSWIRRPGGIGKFLTGRPGPGGWMRPISGSGEVVLPLSGAVANSRFRRKRRIRYQRCAAH